MRCLVRLEVTFGKSLAQDLVGSGQNKLAPDSGWSTSHYLPPQSKDWSSVLFRLGLGAIGHGPLPAACRAAQPSEALPAALAG